jgi:hypothetical protein
MADEHISYGIVINPEVDPMAWNTRNEGFAYAAAPAGRAPASNPGIRGIGLPDRTSTQVGDLKLTSIAFVALRG